MTQKRIETKAGYDPNRALHRAVEERAANEAAILRKKCGEKTKDKPQ